MLPVRILAIMFAPFLFPGLAAGKPLAAQARAEPPSAMHMLLTKTIFHVQVMTVDVRFDSQTDARLKSAAHGEAFSDSVAEHLASIALNAHRALVKLTFLRDVGYDRFLSEIDSSVHCAFEANVIDEKEYQRVTDHLPRWFSSIKDREIKEGDVILYQIGEKSLRTVFLGVDGKTYVDQMDPGPGPRRTVLGSYFASCSDFREPLLQSIFNPGT